MAYDFYLGTMLLPIPPGKLTLKIGNNNKTYTLMNEGEINVLKTPGLTDIEFEALLPNSVYPFAIYKDGFQPANTYLEELERLKTEKSVFQFIVSRVLPNGDILFDTNITCSLEEYSAKEDADEYGTDIMVSVKLKQYREYGVKACKVKTKKTLNLKKLRKCKNVNLQNDEYIWISQAKGEAPITSVKIKKAITLGKLAKKLYGDGELYTVIAEANPAKNGNAKWKKSTKFKKGTNVMIPLTYYS